MRVADACRFNSSSSSSPPPKKNPPTTLQDAVQRARILKVILRNENVLGGKASTRTAFSSSCQSTLLSHNTYFLFLLLCRCPGTWTWPSSPRPRTAIPAATCASCVASPPRAHCGTPSNRTTGDRRGRAVRATPRTRCAAGSGGAVEGWGVGGGDGAAKQAQTHSHGTERGGEDRQTQTQTQTLTHSLCARFKGVSMRALAMRDFVSARRTVESALTDATVAPAVAAEGVRSLD